MTVRRASPEAGAARRERDQRRRRPSARRAKDRPMTTVAINPGDRFGAWTVMGLAVNSKHKQIGWYCRCECGTEKIVLSQSLRERRSTRCNRCARRGPKPVPLEERFWRHVYPDPNCGCWLWDGSCNGHGYGQIRVKGKNRTATRVSWELFKGKIPDGMHLLHRCDFPPCVNPDHLFLGTHRDNIHDALAKGRMNLSGLELGRQPRPEYRPHLSSRKFTKNQIVEIRASPVGKRILARIYGASESVIQNIRSRKTYKEI